MQLKNAKTYTFVLLLMLSALAPFAPAQTRRISSIPARKTGAAIDSSVTGTYELSRVTKGLKIMNRLIIGERGRGRFGVTLFVNQTRVDDPRNRVHTYSIEDVIAKDSGSSFELAVPIAVSDEPCRLKATYTGQAIALENSSASCAEWDLNGMYRKSSAQAVTEFKQPELASRRFWLTPDAELGELIQSTEQSSSLIRLASGERVYVGGVSLSRIANAFSEDASLDVKQWRRLNPADESAKGATQPVNLYASPAMVARLRSVAPGAATKLRLFGIIVTIERAAEAARRELHIYKIEGIDEARNVVWTAADEEPGEIYVALGK